MAGRNESFNRAATQRSDGRQSELEAAGVCTASGLMRKHAAETKVAKTAKKPRTATAGQRRC
jgi:hypothetical protein